MMTAPRLRWRSRIQGQLDSTACLAARSQRPASGETSSRMLQAACSESQRALVRLRSRFNTPLNADRPGIVSRVCCKFHDCLACGPALKLRSVLASHSMAGAVCTGGCWDTKRSGAWLLLGRRRGVDRQKLIIILVGLPGRGKTFLCNKLMCYLNWLGASPTPT